MQVSTLERIKVSILFTKNSFLLISRRFCSTSFYKTTPKVELKKVNFNMPTLYF